MKVFYDFSAAVYLLLKSFYVGAGSFIYCLVTCSNVCCVSFAVNHHYNSFFFEYALTEARLLWWKTGTGDVSRY
jgi:hypothetical protein